MLSLGNRLLYFLRLVYSLVAEIVLGVFDCAGGFVAYGVCLAWLFCGLSVVHFVWFLLVIGGLVL